MNFYTNVHVWGDEVLLRGFENGERVQLAVPYKPYLFEYANGAPTPYRTLKGVPVIKKQYETIRHARARISNHQNVVNSTLFGLTNFGYTFINDRYKGEIQYDVSNVSVTTIDIEVSSKGGFPDIEKADRPLTAITLRNSGHSVVFGLHPYTPEDENVTYLLCESEEHMLEMFIQVWKSKKFNPDIVTGWNVEFFDMPYIVNRIRRVLGHHAVKKLSPWELMTSRALS